MMNSIPSVKLFRQSLLVCSAMLLLASCATRMRISEELEPEQLLPDGAKAYVRVNPANASELIQPFIEPYGSKQTTDLLKRTESMVIAVMPSADSIDGEPGKHAVYAVASGDFPTRSIALKLNLDRNWVRESPGWVHKEEGVRIALSSQGQVILGTAPLLAILPAGQYRPHPVPEYWHPAWYNDLAVYIPDPVSLLGSSLPFDLSGLPLQSMLVSIRRMDTRYDVYLGFEFATERTAMVFAPLCRLFLFALARGLWPFQASEILGAVGWSTQGTIVEATGLRLDALQVNALMALPFGGTIGASAAPAVPITPIRPMGSSR